MVRRPARDGGHNECGRTRSPGGTTGLAWLVLAAAMAIGLLTPVDALYAAGALTSGWIGHDEHRFGTTLSWAIASGRVAALQAIRDIPAESEAHALDLLS